jgi:hypothetical protein
MQSCIITHNNLFILKDQSHFPECRLLSVTVLNPMHHSAPISLSIHIGRLQTRIGFFLKRMQTTILPPAGNRTRQETTRVIKEELDSPSNQAGERVEPPENHVKTSERANVQKIHTVVFKIINSVRPYFCYACHFSASVYRLSFVFPPKGCETRSSRPCKPRCRQIDR